MGAYSELSICIDETLEKFVGKELLEGTITLNLNVRSMLKHIVEREIEGILAEEIPYTAISTITKKILEQIAKQDKTLKKFLDKIKKASKKKVNKGETNA